MLNDEIMFGYAEAHSSKPQEALKWVVKQTHLRTNHSRMLCGSIEGKLLELISKMIRPKRILELGVFTGYSSICLAAGLCEDGKMDSLEINDELEDLILQAYERAGVRDQIDLHIGDALKTMEQFKGEGRRYDLVFIDANKREYPKYLTFVKELLVPGGWIIGDNVLWDGKVYADKVSNDAQTQGIVEFNRMVDEDPQLENVIIPLRDGINLIRKIY